MPVKKIFKIKVEITCVFHLINGLSLWHVCAIPRKYIKVSHERNDLTTMCASIFISVAWRLQHDQQFYTNWATTESVKYLKPKVLGSSQGRWLHSWSGRPGPDLTAEWSGAPAGAKTDWALLSQSGQPTAARAGIHPPQDINEIRLDISAARNSNPAKDECEYLSRTEWMVVPMSHGFYWAWIDQPHSPIKFS